MPRTSLAWGLGVLVVLVVSGGLYRFVGHVGLAVVTGLTWACGVLITLRIARQHPSHTTGERWADKRWTALSTGLMTLAALVGVNSTLPIAADLRFALALLVLGVGFVGYTTGTMAELERAAE